VGSCVNPAELRDLEGVEIEAVARGAAGGPQGLGNGKEIIRPPGMERHGGAAEFHRDDVLGLDAEGRGVACRESL
jgi:hypothetical protein